MDSQSFLDEMIEEDSVQILKAALPYLPASGQSFVSIFAKFWSFKIPFVFLPVLTIEYNCAPSLRKKQILWKCLRLAVMCVTAL